MTLIERRIWTPENLFRPTEQEKSQSHYRIYLLIVQPLMVQIQTQDQILLGYFLFRHRKFSIHQYKIIILFMYVLIRGTAHGKTVVAHHGGRCCAVKASRTSGGHHTSKEVVHHTSRGCEVCGVLFFRSLWSSLLLNSVHVLKLQPTETNINQSNS